MKKHAAPERTTAKTNTAQETRSQILQAALQQFSRRGFEGASVTQIAKAAGVPQPLLNYHFGTKSELWQAVADHLFGRFTDVFGGIGTHLKDLDPVDAMKVVLRRQIEFLAGNPEFFQFVVLETLEDSPRLRYMFDRHIEPFNETLARYSRAGQELGLIKPYLPVQVSQTIAGSMLLFFGESELLRIGYGIDTRDPKTAQLQADMVVDIIFNGLLTKKGVQKEDAKKFADTSTDRSSVGTPLQRVDAATTLPASALHDTPRRRSAATKRARAD